MSMVGMRGTSTAAAKVEVNVVVVIFIILALTHVFVARLILLWRHANGVVGNIVVDYRFRLYDCRRWCRCRCGWRRSSGFGSVVVIVKIGEEIIFKIFGFGHDEDGNWRMREVMVMIANKAVWLFRD